MTKSLVGYTACGETIITAVRKSKIQVRPPLYFTSSTEVSKVCQAFSSGQSHMGFVCDSFETSVYMRDASDRILSSLTDGTYLYEKLEDHRLLGVLTLENVIERILKMDINDEKDHDRKILHQVKDAMMIQSAHERKVSVIMEGQVLFKRGKSIHYVQDILDED